MTSEQSELTMAIDCQRMIIADRPYDYEEKLVLEALHSALRKTFVVVPSEYHSEYIYSPSRAVLKRV